ncbi:MAG: hypothetical protein ACE5K0_09590 [Candidatus Methanofastidiosia archaeon]
MKSYVDLYMNSEGASIRDVISALRALKLKPVAGHHDILIEWENEEEFFEILEKLHKALKGMKVSYRIETIIEEREILPEWPPKSVGTPKE